MSHDIVAPAKTQTAPAPQEGPASSAVAGDLTSLLKALADETRLRIFASLTKTELCVCEIEDILDLPQSLVSNHLAILRRAGLVASRRDVEDARWVFYRADPDAAAALAERLHSLLHVQTKPADVRRAQEVCRLRGR